jgi:hypothetical protein
LSCGCASTTENVRALRQYERDEATPERVARRLQQLTDTLALTRRLLHEVPYRPGDDWVQRLPLDEVAAEQARSLIPDEEDRELLLNVYRAHVERLVSSRPGVPAPPSPAPAAAPVEGVEAPAAPPSPSAGSPAQGWPSIVAGLSHADPGLTLEAGAAHVNESILQDPERARIVRDAVKVTSVALRLTAEAAALATVVTLQAAELVGQSRGQLLRRAPQAAALASNLPGQARAIARDLEANAATLKSLLERLSRLEGIDPMSTAGFQLRDGLVDEIVGFGLDSVHAELNAGGEALFYAAAEHDEFSSNEDGSSYDYTGRLTKLTYQVEPIVLATAQLSLKFDWPHWMEAAGLNLGYATNRVYKSGGDLGTGNLARELGIDSAWSEAFSAALGVAGVRSAVRIARFDHGMVRDVFIPDGTVIAEAPLEFTMKQIDLGYDLAARRSHLFEQLTLGFRYFDYTLPRILYELRNDTPGAESASYVFSRETPPQAVRSRYYMLDLALRIEQPVTRPFTIALGADLAAGYGPTEYYFLRDEEEQDIESNREYVESYGLGVGLAGELGLRYVLLGRSSRLRGFVEARYRVQYLSSLLDSKDEGDTIVKTGTNDVFHGPSGALGIEF